MNMNYQFKRILMTLPVLFLWVGCGPPQVEHEERRLVESLLSAVSTRNLAWLDENVAAIEKRRAEGTLSAAASRSFGEIIGLARGGRWEEAESRAFELRDAQRPTARDREEAERREVAHHEPITPKTRPKGKTRLTP